MTTQATEETTGETKPKRLGRPTDREVPRTTLDAWIVARGWTSQSMATACAEAAARLGFEPETAPGKKSIDDMRTARFYPSLIAAHLIAEVTAGEVSLAQWARDVAKYGGRRRPARASPAQG